MILSDHNSNCKQTDYNDQTENNTISPNSVNTYYGSCDDDNHCARNGADINVSQNQNASNTGLVNMESDSDLNAFDSANDISCGDKTLIKCIFLSKFHATAGSQIAAQVPPNFIPKDVFDTISRYVIPKSQLQRCILTLYVQANSEKENFPRPCHWTFRDYFGSLFTEMLLSISLGLITFSR